MNKETATVAEAQFMSAILEQADAFESGLGEVISGAVENGMHPLAISIANARSVCRIGAAIAASNGYGIEQWEDMIRNLFDSTIEDMKEGFESFVADKKAA